MLTELSISNLGVIAGAQLELAPGLTAVTGETGAGKTMIVSSLGLLLGARADVGLIRRGATAARVDGRFTGLPDTVREQVDELGGELDEPGEPEDTGDPGGGAELVLSRNLRKGRSRSQVGGAAVPAGTAAEIAAELLTIHGQSEQLRLGRPERQRDILDRSGGAELATALAAYQQVWRRRQETASELTDLTENAAERARELDMLTFGLEEIGAVEPQPGEDTELATEAARLQDVDSLRVAANTAMIALAGQDDDIDSAAALTAAATAQRSLAEASDPELAAMAARAGEVAALVADLSSDLASYLDGLSADPARLEAIMERQAALQGLTRKYGADVDEVLQWSADAARRAVELDSGDDRITELTDLLAELDQDLQRTGEQLRSLRSRAAADLAEAVGAELSALAMPHARLHFDLQPTEPGPHGLDQITLLFTANPGSEPRPLAKAASGGELSRVRLALEVVLAGAEAGGTFVFDEVDAGIGGAVAIEVGRRLARLARHSQVIVVTHLAQVAAFADQHYVVVKASDGAVTTSGVTAVEEDQRAAELARMMAGMEDSDTAIAHARELLLQASDQTS